MRLLTFPQFQEDTTPIFKNFKISKLKDIFKFKNTLKAFGDFKNKQKNCMK